MSYILDALKKADAERERDAAAVPDLYAQADAERGARAAARPSGWVLLALAASAAALAVLAWRWFGAAPTEAAPPWPVAQAPAALPAQPPAPTPAAIMSPAAPPQAAAAPMPMPTPAPAAAAPGPARSTAPPPKPARLPAAQTAAPAASAATEARLYTLADLPPDMRRQLPALAVGGAVYSSQATSRIVILNGQVFREGDTPVDGLRIEQIGLKSTVLAFRGLRLELKH
ncbi:MAG: general secretion pathway protein GspB [Burkholderiaceae bacterium]|nr:general secretion pathway protein GspB [Burkholderiaceae bacterium]